MKINFSHAQALLKAFDFPTLFREELGWEPMRYALDVSIGEDCYHLDALAHKRGFTVFRCQGPIPIYAIRRKIDAQVAKSYHEHLIIYTDTDQTTQVWQWVKRQIGKPAASKSHTFRREQSGLALLQKLDYLAVTLEDEEGLTILDVAEKVRQGFDVEHVTKRFYDRFKEEHTAFLKFVAGIPEEGMQRWYVSVTLNRLMFVYFIQKKGFLDGDLDYLPHKLAQSPKGKNRFYRDFLCPLFFQGFACKEHDATTVRLLGKVPYLNGGIFARHQIEELYGAKLDIPDAAFERLFVFFDAYQWHLDERPLRHDDEINPDVLGYIFEKYINQKQMGAYYTKEDITEYNSKNTIIPHIFDVVQRECKVAFEGAGSLWRHLQNDPDRYIYDAVKKGVEIPLPDEIAVGADDPHQRQGWNKAAPDEFALPTEIWREVIARRRHYQEVHEKLAASLVTSINDLITLNLDIRQFAQDVIEDSDADLLTAFWHALTQIKVLDPTVGSGAFLFAALNVLEPMYAACIERMRVLVQELDDLGTPHSPKKYAHFRQVLEQIDNHPNEDYFIFKSIIVNNLYGVDIMEEAVEICKLRLFLKLVAQVEQAGQVEPLPDIDFNIRAGNTLVGFATKEDVRKAVQMGKVGGVETERLFVMPEDEKQLTKIEQKARDIERLFELFRQQQTELGGEVTKADKDALRARLKELDDELNIHLARQYGIHDCKSAEFNRWRESYKPFHWFVEFYGIMKQGGFDVIIGNPPYVELSSIKDYSLIGYQTVDAGNLYAFCLERSLNLLIKMGFVGMVVQQPIVSTQRMAVIRKVFLADSTSIYTSTYDDRPSKLFDGMDHARIAIVLAQKGKPLANPKLYVTPYQKWSKGERRFLFEKVMYVESLLHEKMGIFPKIGSVLESSIIDKILSQPVLFSAMLFPHQTSYRIYYKITGVGSWFTITTRPPRFIRKEGESSSTRENSIYFTDTANRDRAFCILNSSLFYWFYQVRTNCRDFNPSDYKTYCLPRSLLSEDFCLPAGKLQEALDLSSKLVSVTHSKTGSIQYEVFRPREAKPIIDEIDRLLARHYGLTEDELDFIINYDVKYRMGAELEEGEE
ncbi:MAG: DNA methyltransferase [Anaerolineales bacterium]